MFEKILGNNQIKEMLLKSLENGTLSHSYLFIGINGIGKKMLAVEFAKEILCETKKKDCRCKSCVEFNSNNHPDFMCLELEGNSIKIEQIRQLQRKIQEKPILSNKKVYIIDKADTMTKEAQNCLLKTLEEPPEFVTIILIGSNENAFLSTIKSRCMIFRFQPLTNEQIEQYMKENYNIENISKQHLAIYQGSIGKAIAIKDQKEQYDKIIDIIENLNQKDLIDIIKLSEILYSSKEEIYEILEYMNVLLLEKTKENYLYANCINIVEKTKKRLKQNANYDMCIDFLLFNMWEEISLKS